MIELTREEIIYLEKTMDLNASAGEDRIRKTAEQFILCKSLKEEKICEMLMNGLEELYEAQLFTQKIRRKLEEMRK
jgi:hypothetical protein